MTEHYIIPCECGATVRSRTAEAVCDRCGRVLVVEGWGGAPTAPAAPAPRTLGDVGYSAAHTAPRIAGGGE